jgi:hypothetical protein
LIHHEKTVFLTWDYGQLVTSSLRTSSEPPSFRRNAATKGLYLALCIRFITASLSQILCLMIYWSETKSVEILR